MNVKLLSFIPIFAALTAVGAFIKIPIPPVPITMQSFFVLMSGIILGPGAGALSQVIYLIIGLIGLPVFALGSGPSSIMAPSFGYLIGFIPASAIAGYFIREKGFTTSGVFIASLSGMVMIYLFGTPYLAFNFMYMQHKPDAISLAIKVGMLIFLPGDIIKCALLAIIAPKLKILKLDE